MTKVELFPLNTPHRELPPLNPTTIALSIPKTHRRAQKQMAQLDELLKASTLAPAQPIPVLTYTSESMQATTLLVTPLPITTQETPISTPAQTPAPPIPLKPPDHASARTMPRGRVPKQQKGKYNQLSLAQSSSPEKQADLQIASLTAYHLGSSVSIQSLMMPQPMTRCNTTINHKQWAYPKMAAIATQQQTTPADDGNQWDFDCRGSIATMMPTLELATTTSMLKQLLQERENTADGTWSKPLQQQEVPLPHLLQTVRQTVHTTT